MPVTRDRVTREREYKLGIDPLVDLDLARALDAYVTRPRDPRRLVTTYYDTADLRLLRWGCTLRYRLGEGWLVKLPCSTTARRSRVMKFLLTVRLKPLRPRR